MMNSKSSSPASAPPVVTGSNREPTTGKTVGTLLILALGFLMAFVTVGCGGPACQDGFTACGSECVADGYPCTADAVTISDGGPTGFPIGSGGGNGGSGGGGSSSTGSSPTGPSQCQDACAAAYASCDSSAGDLYVQCQSACTTSCQEKSGGFGGGYQNCLVECQQACAAPFATANVQCENDKTSCLAGC